MQNQVAPLLEELTAYTALGPKLRRRKIDVNHIIDSMEGREFGDLIDQVGFCHTPVEWKECVVRADGLLFYVGAANGVVGLCVRHIVCGRGS